MELDLLARLANGAPVFVAFLFSLCFHEFAHGWMAKRKGDNTADVMGRLTLNPFAHADVLGTFILPAFAIFGGGILFGWAKPVPVNSRNLKNPVNDMFWIALAGPASNIILATIGLFSLVFLQLFFSFVTWINVATVFLQAFIFLNLFLAVFNMLPFHPLDGGKVMARFLPDNANRWLEDNAMILNIALIVLFIAGGFRYMSIPVIWLHDKIYAFASAFFLLFI
jgi:Zn-dependent protease